MIYFLVKLEEGCGAMKQPRRRRKSTGPRHQPIRTDRPRHLRSRVTNNRQLFVELKNGNSPWLRRFQDLMSDHFTDLGGFEATSAAERSLVRRCAWITLQLELREQKWAEENDGYAPDKGLASYQRNTNTLRRTLKTLGLERRTRDITPTVEEYARIVAAEEAQEAESQETKEEDA